MVAWFTLALGAYIVTKQRTSAVVNGLRNSVQMIFPASLTFESVTDHASTYPFVRRGQDLRSSEWISVAPSSTVDLPEMMRIAHSSSNIKGTITDRHLLQFSLKKRNNIGDEGTALVNLTLSVPRNGVFDNDDVHHLVSHIYHVIATSDGAETYALINALLRGQV